jgi:hypothetical protein
MTLDVKVDKAWRRFAFTLAAVLVFVAGTFLVTTSYLIHQIGAGDRAAECRSKIANVAEVIRADRDTAQSQFVIATQRRGEARAAGDAAGEKVQFDAASLAVSEVERLNHQLKPALELRGRSVELCSANPDFTPPT